MAGKLSLAVVILLRVLARMSQWQEQVIKCKKFYLFAVGRGLNLSFNINNRTNFFGEIFENTHKNYKFNLVLVVVLILKSKDLY